jgi:ribosomal protein S27E
MEIKCPECGNSASQVLIGTDDRRYAKCLECGEITPCRAASDADVAAIECRAGALAQQRRLSPRVSRRDYKWCAETMLGKYG